MTELKTLKEIEKEIKIEPFKSGQTTTKIKGIVSVKELRQEAIKWIKDFYSCPNFESTKDAVQSFIKYFFNITEKDLK